MSVIETAGLTKRFGPTLALDDLDLVVELGEVFGFLGPNGAGKTTTIRILMGSGDPERRRSASSRWAPARGDAVAIHRRMGYLPSEPSFPRGLTGREFLDYLGRLRGGAARNRLRRTDARCRRGDRGVAG